MPTTDEKFAYVAAKSGISIDELYEVYWRSVIRLYDAYKKCEWDISKHEDRECLEKFIELNLELCLEEVNRLIGRNIK
ncbi:hypothetical protein LG307_14815 [Sutcliffiella horikoshii]|uniref:hypothetical protein n=1 Tax=Sutcliffiella horikoshii TaxID=79883 RepID=UPI00384D5365